MTYLHCDSLPANVILAGIHKHTNTDHAAFILFKTSRQTEKITLCFSLKYRHNSHNIFRTTQTNTNMGKIIYYVNHEMIMNDIEKK